MVGSKSHRCIDNLPSAATFLILSCSKSVTFALSSSVLQSVKHFSTYAFKLGDHPLFTEGFSAGAVVVAVDTADRVGAAAGGAVLNLVGLGFFVTAWTYVKGAVGCGGGGCCG